MSLRDHYGVQHCSDENIESLIRPNNVSGRLPSHLTGVSWGPGPQTSSQDWERQNQSLSQCSGLVCLAA